MLKLEKFIRELRNCTRLREDRVDGDVLNIFHIVNKAFLERAEVVFNPRNAMYISHNNGLANRDLCVQRDSVINANTLNWLGRKYIKNDADRVAHIQSILKHNEENEIVRRDEIVAKYS